MDSEVIKKFLIIFAFINSIILGISSDIAYSFPNEQEYDHFIFENKTEV